MQPEWQSIQSGTLDVAGTQGGSAVARNGVLRNTYQLLSMTLLFTVATAYVGTQIHIGMGMYLVLALGGLGLLFATMALRNSAWGLLLVFAFTGVEGLSLGPVLNHYLALKNGAQIVMSAGGLTAAVFLSLSAYVTVTKKDFSYLGGFLFAGLIIVVLASLLNLFVGGAMMQVTIAAASALLFTGYILYDTSDIVRGGETNYIMATVRLYLDILNLFLALLRILGFLSSDD